MKKSSYEQLRDKWYKKLEKKGFKDIENRDGHLKESSKHFNQNSSGWFHPTLRAAKEEYYRLASHFLNDHEFESKLHEIVWEYHANGISAQKISETLMKAKVSRLRRSAIGNIIRELEAKMKAKYLK